MDIVISKRLSDFIIFSNIKIFVDDLKDAYEDELNKDAEALRSYYHFINDANLPEEINDFVNGFKRALSGKHKAIYCEDVYLNIPEYLKRNDENKKIIKKYLSKINELYEDPSKCKEFVFFKKVTQDISSEVKEKDVEVPESASVERNVTYIQQLLTSLNPSLRQSQQEFKDQDLDINIFIKIILIIVSEKLDTTLMYHKDVEHLQNIIKIILNNPLQEIMSKRLEIIQELALMENKGNIPFQNLLSSFY